MDRIGRRPDSGQLRNIIFIIIVVVIATVFSLVNHSTPVTYDFGEDSFTLTGDKEAPYSVTVRYEGVRSIDQVSGLDLGTPLDGGDTGKCQYGVWQNDAYGEYRLCAWSKVTEYIVLDTAGGIIVCNFEDNASTKGLYDGMVDLLAERRF